MVQSRKLQFSHSFLLVAVKEISAYGFVRSCQPIHDNMHDFHQNLTCSGLVLKSMQFALVFKEFESSHLMTKPDFPISLIS